MIYLFFFSNSDLLSLETSLCVFNKEFNVDSFGKICVVTSASLPKIELKIFLEQYPLVRLLGNLFKPLWGVCTVLLTGGNQPHQESRLVFLTIWPHKPSTLKHHLKRALSKMQILELKSRTTESESLKVELKMPNVFL